MAFSVWPSLRPLAPTALQQIQSEGAPDDETFWAYVRLEFELTPEFTNLVSVVRGNFTKANREIAFNEATRLNQLSAPLPDLNYQRKTRRKVASFIGASAVNIALLRNTTEGVTTVLCNWPLKAGDEILTSSVEHGPFYDTLAQRAARDRVTIRQFHYPAPVTSAQTILDAIDRALTPRTRLVMIGQVVLLGQIDQVRPIADLVHSKGAKLLVDGVLGLGHVPTDVKAMDCDFYAAGFHKFACGPRATAVFYVRPDLVGQLPPLFGSLDEDDRGFPRPKWNANSMDKYEVFRAHPEGQFYALPNAIDLISGIGVDRIQARYFYLTSRWMTRAQPLPKFRAAVTLDPAHCAGLVAWELAGMDPNVVGRILRGNRVRNGRTVRWYSLHLCLKNDSQVTAEKVGAAIKCSKIENRVLQSLIDLEHGRWADGPYPSPEHPKSEINLTDFGPQQIRDLDIALKYPDDVDCYAVNNDNFVGVQELRIDMYCLKGTNVLADVKIQGANLKKNLLCRLSFRNPGKGGKPERLNWIG